MHQSSGIWVFCGDGAYKHNKTKMQGIDEQMSTTTPSDEQVRSGAKDVAKGEDVKHKMQDVNEIHVPYDLDEFPNDYAGNEETNNGLISKTPSG